MTENHIGAGIVLKHALFGHMGVISQIAWEPHSRVIATASYDKTVRIWEPNTGQALKTLTGHEFNVTSISWAPEGQALATASDDRTIKLWNYPECQLIATLSGTLKSISSISWSPNAKYIAASCNAKDLVIWDVRGQKPHKILSGHEHYAKGVTFSHKGHYLASFCDGGEVRLWNGGAFTPLLTMSGHEATVNAASWSPDDKLLATASDDYTVRIWNVKSGTCVQTLEDHSHFVKGVSFSNCGNYLATKSWDQSLLIWRTDTWEVLFSLEEDTVSPLPALSFSPKDIRLASVGLADEVLRIWEFDMTQIRASENTQTISYRNNELELLRHQGDEFLGMPQPQPEEAQDPAFVPMATGGLSCANCGETLTEQQVSRRKALGHDFIQCPVCDAIAFFQLDEEETNLNAGSKNTLVGWAGCAHVTLVTLFTDIVDSTAIQNKVGDRAMKRIRRHHFQRSRTLIQRFGGYEIKTIGDSFMVAFQTALDALDFALELKRDTGHDDIQIRAAMHVGPVDIEENDMFGASVNFCARILGQAKGPEVWTSDEIRNHIILESELRHANLNWLEHTDIEVKGFKGNWRMWSLT